MDKLDLKLGTVRQNFVYPELNDQHDVYAGSILQSPIINPSGDWRKTLPPGEEQRRFGVEPSSCFIEAPQHTVATIEEFSLNEKDNNYSARFNALLAGGTPNGGDPVKGADSIRHDGLVKEEIMPHDSSLQSWEEFHSWKGVDEKTVKAEGKKDIAKKERNFGVIIKREQPLETKYILLEQGLKRSPMPLSVWGATDGNGNYLPKPKGQADTHMVEATYLDVKNKIIHILDTYPPFEKQLPANYNPDFGMAWTVRLKNPQETANSVADSINNSHQDWDFIRKISEFFTQTLLDLKKWLDVRAPINELVPVIENNEMTFDPAPVEKPVDKVEPGILLAEEAKKWLGKDASPLNLAPQEFSCAESVSNIIHSCFSDFPKDIVSTRDLYEELKRSPRFKQVLDPSIGTVVVSPRTPTINGHTGIYTQANKIASTDSKKGLFAENYTRESWRKAFIQGRGLKGYLFSPVD